MSKSIDFCKSVASDPLRSAFADRDWNNAVEDIETEAVFDEFLRGIRSFHIRGKTDDGDDISFNVCLSFDSNADFDYFTSDSCIHDGTLAFIRGSMDKIVRNVCFARTYNKNVGEPKSGDNIKYVIGNFVVLNEDGDQFVSTDKFQFVPTDKLSMSERTTVLLPLKMMKD